MPTSYASLFANKRSLFRQVNTAIYLISACLSRLLSGHSVASLIHLNITSQFSNVVRQKFRACNF